MPFEVFLYAERLQAAACQAFTAQFIMKQAMLQAKGRLA